MKLLFSLMVVLSTRTAITSGELQLPPNHPPHLQLHEFAGQLRCPYAEQWLTKGPKQAARDLGLTPTTFSYNQKVQKNQQQHVRRQQEQEESLQGSCVYTNAFSGALTCTEMRGNLWTLESMQQRCSEAGTDGIVSVGEPCQVTGTLAGFCILSPVQQGMTEATAFVLGGSMSTCAAAQNTCGTFLQGTFEPADECSAATAVDEDASGTAPEVYCEIAPGPIGAAHQAAYSSGYHTNCPGTPAEGSLYMWPTRWSAEVDAKSMAFGSDDVVYHSISKVWYRLDKNWKRQDTYYTRGVQRAIGQGPCPEENIVDTNGPVLSCRRDSDRRRTMIHRGSKMFFISWINGTAQDDDSAENIESCSWLDLQVVGNVRPDWYMDARGDSTDTQYMGDQHVYHDGVPRLIKQWRKTDFADQYFTMSVLANPVSAVATADDGNSNNSTETIHWPMILNVPGEGFGDDFLQRYTNHELLTEEDEAQFLLDEALEAIGGSCPQMESEGEIGPPVGETEPVPSNLEIDPNAWFSNVYTFSPIWEPPVEEENSDMSSAMGSAVVTEAGSVLVESCWDPNMNAVDLTVTFTDTGDGGELPWMALGYRKDEECLMTPRGGGDSEIILISNDPQNNKVLDAFYGSLSPAAKSFDSDAVGAIYASLVTLDQVTGFSNVQVSVLSEEEDAAFSASSLKMPEGSVQLRFQQSMEGNPDVMHLMYAIGSSPQLGYHASRMCFEVNEFPICQSALTSEDSGEESDEVPTQNSSTTTSETTGASDDSGSLQLFSFSSILIILAAASLSGMFV